MTGRVLLAVDEASADVLPDDRVLTDRLASLGVDVAPVIWGAEVDPDSMVLIRSTWDYVERPAAFLAWLDGLDARDIAVVNPTSLLRWNVHKRYLGDLAAAGVPVVPTELVHRGSPTDLDEVRSRRGWSDVVVKPAIGGSARLAVHAGRVGEPVAAEHFAGLVAREDALVQPFVPSVVTDGEVSVLAIAGEPLAAVAKRAAAGDWRVQSDFGGIASRVDLTPELAALAERSLTATPSMPVAARVDAVRTERGWELIELELVEPELFLRLAPDVADALARHVAALVRLRH